MDYKVNEIFTSIQGEGIEVGQAMIFLRLSGCNRNCSFCDTDWENFKVYSIEELLKELESHGPSKKVLITGGEPTLQDIRTLTLSLREHGYRVSLETNGTNIIEGDLADLFDTISIAPKDKETLLNLFPLPSNAIVKLLVPHFSVDSIHKFFWLLPSQADNLIYIMPVNDEGSIDGENTEKAMEIVYEMLQKYRVPVRFGTQYHKYLEVK